MLTVRGKKKNVGKAGKRINAEKISLKIKN